MSDKINWKVLARAEVKLQKELEREFARHEEAIRKLLIRMRVERKP